MELLVRVAWVVVRSVATYAVLWHWAVNLASIIFEAPAGSELCRLPQLLRDSLSYGEDQKIEISLV